MNIKKIIIKLGISTVLGTMLISNSSFAMNDIANDYWAKPHIDRMINKGIVSGYSDGSFRPKNNITREEVSKILSTYIGGNYTGENKFSDVIGWSSIYINHLSNLDIINGYPDGTFNPKGSITRAEISSMIYKYLEYQGKLSQTNFIELSDINSNWAKNYIQSVANSGYISGYPDHTFKPNYKISRSEVCAIIANIDGIKLNEGSNNNGNNTVPGSGLIKGNHSSSGEKIYHIPGGAYYDKTKAEVYFQTEADAIAAGFRKSKR